MKCVFEKKNTSRRDAQQKYTEGRIIYVLFTVLSSLTSTVFLGHDRCSIIFVELISEECYNDN